VKVKQNVALQRGSRKNKLTTDGGTREKNWGNLWWGKQGAEGLNQNHKPHKKNKLSEKTSDGGKGRKGC